MNKPQKPKKPKKNIFPPQKKIFEEKSHYNISSRFVGYCEDILERVFDTWDGDNPENHWKNCILNVEGYISLEKAIKIAKKKNLSFDEIYFGLFFDEDHIRMSLFSIEEKDNNPYYEDFVKQAERDEYRYKEKLKRYNEDSKNYKLKLKQYLESMKQDAEQGLRELEREEE